MENDSNHIHCEDELRLQRLVDEELDADAGELVFHHVSSCSNCAAILQELKEAKSLCEKRLGFEDESEAAYSAAAIARVCTAIETAITIQAVSGTAAIGKRRDQLAEEDPVSAVNQTSRLKKRWLQSLSLRSDVLLRPGFVTLVAAVLLVIGVVLWLRAPRPVSAAELLQRSITAEEAVNNHPEQVLRRTINLETRVAQAKSFSDATLLRQRIEIWQGGGRSLVARRLFDEKDRLLAGEWKRADGSQVSVRGGEKPQFQPALDRKPEALLQPEHIWLLDVSAKDFSALIGNVNAARVEETGGTYVISYDAQALTSNGLVAAKLFLSKADLHTIEQTLVVRSQESGAGSRDSTVNSNHQSAGDSQQWTEYHFSETSFERRNPSTVAPAVFEPDPSVLAANKSKDESGRMKDESAPSSDSSSLPTNAPPLVASSELEVEVLEKLNRANALLGEQLNLTRTPEGALLVSGIVETSERKAEILRSLGDVVKNPAVKVEVSTVAEAQKRQQSGQRNVTVEDIQVSENKIPVDAELRSFLSRNGYSGTQLEQAIEQLSRRVLSHSSKARSHALALKQIAERFSAADLERMDPKALTRWRALIKEHADFFRHELEQARQELGPIFPNASASNAAADIEIANDKDIARAAKRLFDLASMTDNDLRRSLSLSSSSTGDGPVRSSQFWRSFASAESLAAKISRQ